MKQIHTLSLSAGLLAPAVPMSADAEILVAGWDTFTSEPESSSPATILDANTTAIMSGVTDASSWNDWNNGAQGASDDGTFGNLDPSVAAASTVLGTGSNQNTNLSMNRAHKDGSLTFELVNNSGSDRTFQGFYFDGAIHFNQSAPDWELSFSGAISGTAVSGSLTSGDMNDLAPADRDKGIDLLGLTDNVWEAGSTATFTLAFTGGPDTTQSGGGHETLVDNIGITITPEPSSLALIGLGSLLVARRRRG